MEDIFGFDRNNIEEERAMKYQWTVGRRLCFIFVLFTIHAFASPIPDTGQTKCYDTVGNVITCPSASQPFYGQDGNFCINPLSYTKLDNNGYAIPDSATSWTMIRDNVTGLIWEMKIDKDGIKNYSNPHDSDNTYTWYDSNPATNGGNAGTPGDGTNTESFIKALNDAKYGGSSDWRLPSDKELASIVNFSLPYPGPTIDTIYFPNTFPDWHWTRTTLAEYTDNAWLVLFDYSYVHAYLKSNSLYVRAVRGAKSDDAGRYQDNGDGTVTDMVTGLMWQQSVTSNKTWEQALAHCEGLDLGGYTDWRLPSAKELRSLVDTSRSNPAIDTTYFPDTPAAWFWTGTTSAYKTYDAWIVNFYFGDVDGHNKTSGNDVRAVRGGQAAPTYPVLDIEANGQQGPVTTTPDMPISITASLDPGDLYGKPAEWWVAANTPWGWYALAWYDWISGIYPLVVAPLFSLPAVEIFNGFLPAGDYTFYFLVDMNPDGLVAEPFYYDAVQVHVKP